jgi:DNA ligase (NAD+)
MSEKIREYLNYAARMYYAGEPIVSDEVFDNLADSIGYNSLGAKQHDDVCKHTYRMYSLQKYYENEGSNHPLEGINDISASIKLDGAAIAITYLYRKLTRVLTRGDGVEGTDITEKFIGSKLIPQELDDESAPDLVQITGEIAAPKHIENARNYAAGSLSLKDVEEFKTRAVEFFAYGVQPLSVTSTYNQDMQWLSTLGFNTIKTPELHNIYPSDGVVFRVNSNRVFLELGYTAKHPRGAYALKERNEAVETVLLDVVWQTGKSGKVTPVGILEPVKIGDALVSRATLNNIAFIRALDLHIGDTVGVVRAGDIIPQITHKVE